MTPPPHDPLAAWRPGAGAVLLVVAAGALVLAYPFALPWALPAVGARGVAAACLVPVGATFLLGSPAFLARPERPFPVPFLGALRASCVALLLAALLLGDPRPLRLVPAAIQLFLCAVFAASLRAPRSLIERAARFLQPRAPDFVGPYCRGVTAVFAALFGANAVVLAALALGVAPRAWASFAGWGVYAVLAALTCVEYCVRKAWFRYYGAGPIDRLWALALPPERTERGRRSLAYIRRMHDEMRAAGLEPPPEGAPR